MLRVKMAEQLSGYECTGREQDEFAVRLEYWQEYFKAASDTESRAVQEYAIRELDEAWPYHDKTFYASGIGIYPVVRNVDGRPQVEDVYGEIEAVIGKSFGMCVLKPTESHYWRPMYQFIIKDEVTPTGTTIVNHHRAFCFMDPENSSIFPLEAIDDVYLPKRETIPEILPISDVLNQQAAHLLNIAKMQTFKDRSDSQKQRLIQAFLNRVEGAIPIRSFNATIEGKQGFARVDEKLVSLDLSQSIITGSCLGLDVMQDDELFDDMPQLCLVINPDEDTRSGLGLLPRQAVHVPIANQDLEVLFYGNSV